MTIPGSPTRYTINRSRTGRLVAGLNVLVPIAPEMPSSKAWGLVLCQTENCASGNRHPARAGSLEGPG
jgi:hypothetical protein